MESRLLSRCRDFIGAMLGYKGTGEYLTQWRLKRNMDWTMGLCMGYGYTGQSYRNWIRCGFGGTVQGAC